MGAGEFLLIGLVALLVFGPDELPTLLHQMGRLTRVIKRLLRNWLHDVH